MDGWGCGGCHSPHALRTRISTDPPLRGYVWMGLLWVPLPPRATHADKHGFAPAGLVGGWRQSRGQEGDGAAYTVVMQAAHTVVYADCACGGGWGLCIRWWMGTADTVVGMEPRSGVTVLIRVWSDSAARGRWGGGPRGSPGGAGL